MTIEKFLEPRKKILLHAYEVGSNSVSLDRSNFEALIAKCEQLGNAAVIGETVCSNILKATEWELAPSVRDWIAENMGKIRAALEAQ